MYPSMKRGMRVKKNYLIDMDGVLVREDPTPRAPWNL